MSNAHDRRAPGASRIPFEAMVEVGGALGPSFEAQAVNLSEEGMHLRTAYLPEVGQPVTCRFDAGQGMVVVAAGEVLWKEDAGDGGEFGIRFTNLDAGSTVALQRIVGMVEEGLLPRPPQGRKVRLHIEGLASPMRARVKGEGEGTVTAFSELGFLQVGKALDLEDASTGDKRPAQIDRVEVEVCSESRIPQLVVTLRYEDAMAAAAEPRVEIPVDETTDREVAEMPVIGRASSHDDDAYARDEMDDDLAGEASAPMEAPAANASAAIDDDDADDAPGDDFRGKLARNAAKVAPTLETWAKRAKTTLAVLAARAAKKRGGSGDDVEIPVRRTTAPAPGGGLHASGRKVVRTEIAPEKVEEKAAKPKIAITKKRAIAGGAIGVAAILAYVAIHKPAEPVAAAPAADSAALAAAAPPAAAPAPVAPAAPPAAPANDPLAMGDDVGSDGEEESAPPAHHKAAKPKPFGNGPVGHGNVLRLKMDGPIEKILGASQPAGFTVVLPSRKALDGGERLARRDDRILKMRVANEPSGAELSVTFKDGVPNYQVRARGDVLEMVLARPAQEKSPEAHAPRHKKRAKRRH